MSLVLKGTALPIHIEKGNWLVEVTLKNMDSSRKVPLCSGMLNKNTTSIHNVEFTIHSSIEKDSK